MDYDEAIEWVYSTQLFGMKLGLESMALLLAELGIASDEPTIIHVAGTNGKGSVCAMADSILREAGLRVGLFTSPHLVSYRERIVIGGEMVAEDAVALWLTEIRDLVAGWETHPTFFEITLGVAMLAFSHAEVDVIVLETGMGGRLDATNVVTPAVSVITPIGLDHTQWLGETIELVAAEKAGIIKPGVPVVAAPQPAGAQGVLVARAQECGSPLQLVGEPYAGEVGLIGAHQRMNAAVAIAALRLIGRDVPGAAIGRGLARVSWRARFQRVGEGLVIDGAHNPAAAQAVVAAWREVFGGRRATVLFGAVESKDVGGVLDLLSGIAGRWVFTSVNSVRSLPADQLAGLVEGDIRIVQDAEEALDEVAEDPLVLVCGSLFLAGEVLGLIEGGAFERSAQ